MPACSLLLRPAASGVLRCMQSCWRNCSAAWHAPITTTLTSGMPLPEAAGLIKNRDRLDRNASSRLKPMNSKNLGTQASCSDCSGRNGRWHVAPSGYWRCC